MSIKLSTKVRDFLHERRLAVLGTINKDGTVQLTPMWFLLEGDVIVMNTKKGRTKDRNMRRNPHISICVMEEYSYLTISGTAELIDNPKIAQEDVYRLAIRYNGEEVAKQQMKEKFSKQFRETIHLKIEQIIDNLP